MTSGTKRCATALLAAMLLLTPIRSFAASDAVQHAGLSAIFGAAGESLLHYKTELGTAPRIVYGTIIGSTPGLIKELIDSGEEDNHFSGEDLAADVVGAFLGAVIANWVNNKILVSVDKEHKKVSVSLLFEF